MKQLFQPKGEEAMWKIFYDNVKDISIGSFLSYQRIKELTGFNVQNDSFRGILYRANKELLKEHNKLLVNKRSEGYIVALPETQLKHAMFRKTRASRQLSKGLLEATYCATRTPEEKERQTYMINHFQSMVSFVSKKHEKAIKIEKKAIAAHEDTLKELENMKGQLAELEKKIKG